MTAIRAHPPQDLRTYTDPHFGDRYEDGSIRAA